MTSRHIATSSPNTGSEFESNEREMLDVLWLADYEIWPKMCRPMRKWGYYEHNSIRWQKAFVDRDTIAAKTIRATVPPPNWNPTPSRYIRKTELRIVYGCIDIYKVSRDAWNCTISVYIRRLWIFTKLWISLEQSSRIITRQEVTTAVDL